MEIISTSLHQINHTEDSIKKIPVLNTSEQLSLYLMRLFDDISSTNDKRKFHFRSNTTQVRSSLDKMLSENFHEAAEINAQRLLNIEKQTQERINLNIEIQKGSLFQALVKDKDRNRIIISKADHNEYLDEADFELHTGLPWKKRVFKAIAIDFQEDLSLNSVYVYDTNYTMSKYWWQDYLELREQYTDSENTKKSLDLLDKKIFKPLERKYPLDYVVLRNMMIGFYRTEEEFNLEKFVNKIEKYHPYDTDLPIQKMHEQVLEMPEKWGFDSRFTIEKKSISKRKKTRVKLIDGIELVIDYVAGDLTNMIAAEADDEGNKFIRIRATEESYKYFSVPEK